MGETQMTKTRKTSNSSVRISYNYAAPIDGAEWGYGRFDTLSELETLIRANAFAYGTMNGFIEAELNAQLRR